MGGSGERAGRKHCFLQQRYRSTGESVWVIVCARLKIFFVRIQWWVLFFIYISVARGPLLRTTRQKNTFVWGQPHDHVGFLQNKISQLLSLVYLQDKTEKNYNISNDSPYLFSYRNFNIKTQCPGFRAGKKQLFVFFPEPFRDCGHFSGVGIP